MSFIRRLDGGIINRIICFYRWQSCTISRLRPRYPSLRWLHLPLLLPLLFRLHLVAFRLDYCLNHQLCPTIQRRRPHRTYDRIALAPILRGYMKEKKQRKGRTYSWNGSPIPTIATLVLADVNVLSCAKLSLNALNPCATNSSLLTFLNFS